MSSTGLRDGYLRRLLVLKSKLLTFFQPALKWFVFKELSLEKTYKLIFFGKILTLLKREIFVLFSHDIFLFLMQRFSSIFTFSIFCFLGNSKLCTQERERNEKKIHLIQWSTLKYKKKKKKKQQKQKIVKKTRALEYDIVDVYF